MEKKITIIGIVIAVMLFPIAIMASLQLYALIQVNLAVMEAEAEAAAEQKRLLAELRTSCIDRGSLVETVEECIERNKRSWGITD